MTNSTARLDQDNRLLAKTLLSVALPIALQSLIGSSLNFIDNIMVGKLGELELASVGVGVQIYFVYWMIIFGFTSGCATYVSQFFGAEDPKHIKATLGFSTVVCLTIGIFFFLISEFFPEQVMRLFTEDEAMLKLGKIYISVGAPCYILMAVSIPLSMGLRVTQQQKIPMAISVFALTCNTVLNYILIFGHFGFPKMGVEGAALATVISRSIEAILILIMVFKRQNILVGRLGDYFTFSKKLVSGIVRNSLPTTVNETMWGLGMSTCAAVFARAGVTQYAAFQASNAISSLFMMAAFSIGDAILILSGQRLGAGLLDEAYNLAKKLLRVSMGIGIIGGIFMFSTTNFFVGFFDFSPEGAVMAKYILWVYAVAMWAHVYSGAIITGVLRCGGDTKFAMITETATVWLIQVPLAVMGIFLFQLPIYYVILLVKIEEAVKIIILTIRTNSRKWVRNVVSDITAFSETEENAELNSQRPEAEALAGGRSNEGSK